MMVIRGDDPRISPADLRTADCDAEAMRAHNTRRRIEGLEAHIVALETRLAWAQRELRVVLAEAQTTMLDGARAEYVTQTTTDGTPMPPHG